MNKHKHRCNCFLTCWRSYIFKWLVRSNMAELGPQDSQTTWDLGQSAMLWLNLGHHQKITEWNGSYLYGIWGLWMPTRKLQGILPTDHGKKETKSKDRRGSWYDNYEMRWEREREKRSREMMWEERKEKKVNIPEQKKCRSMTIQHEPQHTLHLQCWLGLLAKETNKRSWDQ